MLFTHDVQMALRSAVWLVNTAGEADPRLSVSDLDAYYRRFEYTGRHDRTRAEADAVLALRPQLRTMLLAPRDEAAALVNAVLAHHRAVPRLERHDPFDWHPHTTDPAMPWPARIAVETAMAMIDVIRADEHSRIGVCDDDSCEDVVLDLSRNRSKRYCSVACSNRNAVAAYRARQAGASAAPERRPA